MAETLDAALTADTANLTSDSASWWKRLDAKDDWANTDEDHSIAIDVLGNDVGALGIVKVGDTSVTADTPPVTLKSGATVDLEGKTLLYDPGDAFQGLNSGQSDIDQFTYSVVGEYKGMDTATVHVSIAGVTDDDPSSNQPPVAADDKAYLPSYYPYPLPYEEAADSTTATTTDVSLSDDLIATTLAIGEEGDPYPYPSSVNINVLANDTDADGDPLQVATIAGTKVDTDPTTDVTDTVSLEQSSATVKLNANGSLTYTEKYVDIDPVPLTEQGGTVTTNSDGTSELVSMPYPREVLVDSFTYSVSDGMLSDDASVGVYRTSDWYVLGSEPAA